MCGGDGLYHLIGTLAAPASQLVDLTHEVKLMYARGHIDSERFHLLLAMAKEGALSREDLLHIGSKVQHHESLGLRNESAGPADRASQSQHTRLSELETQLSRLQAQAEDAERAAQKPNLTEEQVRAYLETQQGALFRAHRVQTEIEALKNGKFEN